MTARIGQPLRMAALTAPRVSAVSPGLGDGHDQRLRADDGVAIAKLGAEIGLRRQPRELLDHDAPQHGRVVRGPAGHDHHPLEGAHRGGIEVHVGQDHAARLGGDPSAEGVGDGARLLVDLLEHEVPVAALLGHDRIPQDADGLPVHGVAIDGGDVHPVGGDHRHVAVLEDHHVARMRENGGDVGGHEHLPAPQSHHHAPRPLLGCHQPVRSRRGDDADGVGALHLRQRPPHRGVEPSGLFR